MLIHIETKTKEIRIFVVDDRTLQTLHGIIINHVATNVKNPTTIVHDGWKSYSGFA